MTANLVTLLLLPQGTSSSPLFMCHTCHAHLLQYSCQVTALLYKGLEVLRFAVYCLLAFHSNTAMKALSSVWSFRACHLLVEKDLHAVIIDPEYTSNTPHHPNLTLEFLASLFLGHAAFVQVHSLVNGGLFPEDCRHDSWTGLFCLQA